MSRNLRTPRSISLALLLVVLAAVAAAQFWAPASAAAQTGGCDPATGACPSNTPGPTCGLPGLPDCPTNPPPPPQSNPPTNTPKPRPLPTRTSTATPTATPTSTNTPTATLRASAVVSSTPAGPCFNPADGSGSPHRPTCTPRPCVSLGSDRPCTATPASLPVTGTSPVVPPALGLGVIGLIIVVCLVGIGLGLRYLLGYRRAGEMTDGGGGAGIGGGGGSGIGGGGGAGFGGAGGMADGSVKVELNPQPLPPGGAGGMGDGSVRTAGSQFQKADDQFIKGEGQGASQFQKADNQFLKYEKGPGSNGQISGGGGGAGTEG